MWYGFENFMAPEFFQSWCASVRDQSTLQMIAGATLQHQVMHRFEEVVESGAEFVEHELELPFLPAPAPAARPAPRRVRRAPRHAVQANPVHH